MRLSPFLKHSSLCIGWWPRSPAFSLLLQKENTYALSRNGRTYNVSGNTTVRAGTEIKATTEQSPVNISVSESDSGSWVIVELPGFATANAGTAQNSLDALRNATATSYYKGDGLGQASLSWR